MASFAKLIELLEKHRRTVDENEDLYKILTTSPFFESLLHNLPLSDDEMLKVCSHLKLERAESGTMVAKQNTKANLKLYFILEGTVSIFRIDPSVPQSLAEFTNNELLEMYKYEKLLTNSQPLKQRGTMVYSFNDPMMISIKEQYENEQKNTVQGSIGERTLQSSPRTIDNRRRSRVTSIPEQVQTAPKTSEDQLKLIHSQFAEGNYLQATFNTINSMLASLKKAIRFNVLLPMSELFQRFCRKYLGRVVRELGPGSSFGERALQGETLRSASVITTTPCIFIYLEAGEYNAFVKASATARTVEKIQLIYNSFQGSEKMDNEDFWQFQFLFDVRSIVILERFREGK